MKRTQEVVATREWPESAWTLPEPSAVLGGDMRGEIVTRGPWGVIASYRALATTWGERDGGEFRGDYRRTMRILGVRTLTDIRESGYDLVGKVSINGRKYRAFTSSDLFYGADGKLVSVATLHVCM